ncbi:MAG: Na/Pi symporter [Candidatus Delongbacteria bacterium]
MENKSQYGWAYKSLSMLFSLWFFLLSIKLLGEVFKHYFSSDVTGIIQNATSNPFVALFIGILTTAVIQSSSTTTSIIVAFVGAGTMSFENAIPMVMGANIGTSVTGIIVAFGQVRNKLEFHRSFAAAVVHDFFNWFAVLVFLPIEIYTGFIARTSEFFTTLFVGTSGVSFRSPLDSLVKSVSKFIENFIAETMGYPVKSHELMGKVSHYPDYDGLLLTVMIIFSLICLFISLNMMSSIMKKLLIGKFERIIHKFVFSNAVTALIFGLLFTISVQSSSITISLIVPLVGAGIFTIEQIFPYAVGANIGTTITGILASLVTGNTSAISIAFAHTLFNIFGALLFVPLRVLPIRSAEYFALKVKKNRIWAVVFLLVIFFIIPITIIFI